MRQHRTLGTTSRAGGIKQPCQMAPINRSGLDRFARSHFLVACGPRQHDVFQANDVARYFRYAVCKVIADETDLGASIFEDIGEFPGVQTCVHRHDGEPRVPCSEHNLGIFRGVFHRDGDPISGLDAGQR